MSQDFVVTARKWRPQQYKDVVGQEHITQTLQNSIKTGRIHHANLFCGPRGVGKTTTARIHARALNCLNLQDYEPCNECESCLAILKGTSMDVIEIDGASNNSVEDVRKLRENAKYPPSVGKFKMFIIDEVHMLSTSAFNALLKILEEPPKHLIFVFATTESHKVPATIISRCQRFDFRRMEIENIVNQLKYISDNEGITIDDASLVTIAKKGDGSMRDSQSIFDRAIAFCGKDVNFKILSESLHLIDEEFYFKIGSQIRNKEIGELFLSLNEVITKGYDLIECLRGLIEYYRNILTIKETNNSKLIDTTESYIIRYKAEAENISRGDLLRYINYLIITEKELKFAAQPRIKFELALIQLASMTSVLEIEVLISELKDLKKYIAEGKLDSLVVDNEELSSEKKNYLTENDTNEIDENQDDNQLENKVENKFENKGYNQEINKSKDFSKDFSNDVTNNSENLGIENKGDQTNSNINSNKVELSQEYVNNIWKKLENDRVFINVNISNLKDCKPILRYNLLGSKELVIITDNSFLLDLIKSKRLDIIELVHNHISNELDVTIELQDTDKEENNSQNSNYNSYRKPNVNQNTFVTNNQVQSNAVVSNIPTISELEKFNKDGQKFGSDSFAYEDNSKPIELNSEQFSDIHHMDIAPMDIPQMEMPPMEMNYSESQFELISNSNRNQNNIPNQQNDISLVHPNIIKNHEIDTSKLSNIEKYIVANFVADMILDN